MLPPRCELVCWLEVEGAGEVERVALVRHGRALSRDTRILKLYRPGFGPAAEVHEAWRTISDRDAHVVRLREFGPVDNHVYEVMDDVGDRVGGDAAPPSARRTTLRDVLAAHPGGLAEERVVDLVGQLCRALAALGRAGLAHLDLRPENVLVTRAEAEDPQLTLVDLGSGVRLSQERMWVATPPESGYAAPELLLSGTVTAATDWWSLGIMAAELASGGHPLLRMDVRIVRDLLRRHESPEPTGLSDRVATLVAGLTADGEKHRWGAEEVGAWVVGGTPAVPPSGRPAPARPFVFGDEEFRHLQPLMIAFQERWDEAAAVLFGPQADRFDELAAWLTQFDGHGFAAREIVALLQQRGRPPHAWSADARLLVLLRRAAPGLPPLYRNLPVDRQVLRQCDDENDPRLPELVEDLWRWRLLTELDGAAGARGLADVDALWQRLDARWRAVAVVLADDGGSLHTHLATLHPTRRRALLLRVAADEDFRTQLRRDLVRLRADVRIALGTSLPRFEELAAAVLPPPGRRRAPDPDVDELVGLLMLRLVGEGVRQDARDARVLRDAAAADAATRGIAWRRDEHWREAERPVAMGWAAAAMGIVFLVAAAVLITGDAVGPQSLPLATDDAVGLAWAFVVVGLGAQTACEVLLAALIGAPYHREHSLFTILRRAAAPVARCGREGYPAAAAVLAGALAVGAVVLVLLLLAPWAVMVVLLAVHVRSARQRHAEWRTAHEDHRRAAHDPQTPTEGRLP